MERGVHVPSLPLEHLGAHSSLFLQPVVPSKDKPLATGLRGRTARTIRDRSASSRTRTRTKTKTSAAVDESTVRAVLHHSLTHRDFQPRTHATNNIPEWQLSAQETMVSTPHLDTRCASEDTLKKLPVPVVPFIPTLHEKKERGCVPLQRRPVRDAVRREQLRGHINDSILSLEAISPENVTRLHNVLMIYSMGFHEAVHEILNRAPPARPEPDSSSGTPVTSARSSRTDTNTEPYHQDSLSLSDDAELPAALANVVAGVWKLFVFLVFDSHPEETEYEMQMGVIEQFSARALTALGQRSAEEISVMSDMHKTLSHELSILKASVQKAQASKRSVEEQRLTLSEEKSYQDELRKKLARTLAHLEKQRKRTRRSYLVLQNKYHFLQEDLRAVRLRCRQTEQYRRELLYTLKAERETRAALLNVKTQTNLRLTKLRQQKLQAEKDHVLNQVMLSERGEELRAAEQEKQSWRQLHDDMTVQLASHENMREVAERRVAETRTQFEELLQREKERNAWLRENELRKQRIEKEIKSTADTLLQNTALYQEAKLEVESLQLRKDNELAKLHKENYVISSLEEAITALDAICAQRLKAQHEAEAAHAEMKLSHDTIKSTVADVMTHTLEQKQSLSLLQADIRGIEQNISAGEKQLAFIKAEHTLIDAELQKQRQSQADELAPLKSRIEEATKKKYELRQRKDQLKTGREVKATKVEQLSDEIARAKLLFEKSRAQIMDEKATIKKATKVQAGLVKDVDYYEREVACFEPRMTTFKERQAKAHEEQTRLQEQMQRSESEHTARFEQNQGLYNELCIKRKQLGEEKTRVRQEHHDELAQLRARLQEESDAVKSATQAVQNEHDVIQAELHRMALATDVMDIRVQPLASECKRNSQQIHSFKEYGEQELRETITSRQQQLVDIERANEEAKKRIGILRPLKAAALTRKYNAEKRHRELKQQRDDLLTEANRLEAHIQAYDEAVRQTERTFSIGTSTEVFTDAHEVGVQTPLRFLYAMVYGDGP